MKSTSKMRGVCVNLISILVPSIVALLAAMNVEAPSDGFLALVFGATVVIMTITHFVASHYWRKTLVLPTLITLSLGYIAVFHVFERVMSLYGHHRGISMILDGLIWIVVAELSFHLRLYNARLDRDEKELELLKKA